MKNIGKLINFSIKGVVPQSHELVNDLQNLAEVCFLTSHRERQRHLNYQGVDFEFLHLNLEKHYTELESFYDVVAEYIRKLGYKVNEFQSRSDTRGKEQFECPVACMNCSVTDMELVLNGIYQVLHDVHEIPNEMVKIQLSGLESDFTAEISKLDQMNWLFRSRLGESDIKSEDKQEVLEPIQEPGSLVHEINEDIQYPKTPLETSEFGKSVLSDPTIPTELPVNTGYPEAPKVAETTNEPRPEIAEMSVIGQSEPESQDPLGAKEPEPDHTSLFARLYQKLRGYGRRFY